MLVNKRGPSIIGIFLLASLICYVFFICNVQGQSSNFFLFHLWFGKWAFLGIKMGKVRICKCEGGNAPHSALLPRADGCMPREAPQRPAAAIFAVQMQAHLQIRAAHLQMRPAHHSAFVNARVHSLIL